MPSVSFFFSGWEPLARIAVVTPLAYLALLVLFRTTGNRTLSRMNSFDFIVTIAIGSAFGRVMTARSIPLAEAVAAFTALIVLQYVVAWLRVRSPAVRKIATTPPTLLYFRGRILGDALRAERVTEDELLAAARRSGLGSLGEADAIVLEANGRLSVVKSSSAGDHSALAPVNGALVAARGG